MSMTDVTVVNYEAGNIASVVNMAKRLGYSCNVENSRSRLLEAKRVILPGVGAFDAGMAKLREHDLVGVLRELAFEKKVPFLGICLGAQLLGSGSEEGKLSGLGWLDFECLKFESKETLKVPHMGWNYVQSVKQSQLSNGLPQDARFYFVHSYYMKVHDSSQVLFKTDYGSEFVSGVVKGNIYGVQFHPEKSHSFGMKLMKNFLEISNVS